MRISSTTSNDILNGHSTHGSDDSSLRSASGEDVGADVGGSPAAITANVHPVQYIVKCIKKLGF
jgi:hypothetical protein